VKIFGRGCNGTRYFNVRESGRGEERYLGRAENLGREMELRGGRGKVGSETSDGLDRRKD